MPFVQVTIVRGRTVEQKHALIASVSAAVAAALRSGQTSGASGGQPCSAVRAPDTS